MTLLLLNRRPQHYCNQQATSYLYIYFPITPVPSRALCMVSRIALLPTFLAWSWPPPTVHTISLWPPWRNAQSPLLPAQALGSLAKASPQPSCRLLSHAQGLFELSSACSKGVVQLSYVLSGLTSVLESVETQTS